MPRLLALLAILFTTGSAFAAEPPKLSILFLGDNAGHKPKDRFAQLEPVLLKRGIALKYTDSLDDLTLVNLNKYDGLMIYANHGKGTPEQVKAILDYVASGKGFIPLHCASFCFIDNADYVNLVGAQFRSHTTGTFRTKAVTPDHAIMKGFNPFESWDETYVHHKHNEKDRTVLEVRAEGKLEEPWTWVRTHGKGRVFYTAWGHDQRTWGHEGFHNLVERGTRWACGQDPALAGEYADGPKMKPITGDPKDFEFRDAKIPFYPPSKQWGVLAEPLTKMQKLLTPEKSITHYTTPEGFEMKPFAVDEQFAGGKPLAMTWDERGRLWVSVTTDYPNELKKEGEGRDKILILEDTDGDGKADKVTTFADKLSIPTSLLCVRGGVIVHQAPDTLFLKDTDGDGKADVRIKLFTGWGTNDTHAGPSNLRYGFDNWIYGMVGYSGFNGTVNGEKLNFRQGMYRFKMEASLDRKVGDSGPAVSKLEFLRSTNNNSWGLGFDETGELFGSTANNGVLVHMPIPNRYYEKVKGLNPAVLAPIADSAYNPVTENIRQMDWHGKFTSAAGCAIYTARTYPKEYWNRTAFVSDPTGHLTATFVLKPEGTSYTARYGWNLVASRDEWAAPIDAQVGPDGNVWVLDWYNFIVQHNPTPQGYKTGAGNAYETDLRDKKHGRIYRVVYTKAKPEKQPDLKDAKVETLVETLKNDNLFWRLQAQRLIVERGKDDVLPALFKLLGDQSVDSTGLNAGAVHATWAIATLGSSEAATTALLGGLGAEHPSPAVRRATWNAIPKIRDTETTLSIALNLDWPERDPQVRLAIYLALADLPAFPVSRVAKDVTKLLLQSTPDGRVLRDALIAASSNRTAYILMGAGSIRQKPTAEGLAALEMLARHYAAGGGDVMAESVLTQFLGKDSRTDIAVAVIDGLASGWVAGKVPELNPEPEEGLPGAMPDLMKKLPPASRSKLLKLASTWGVKGLEAQLVELTKAAFTVVADAKASDAARLDAAKQVLEFQPSDEAAALKLLDALTPTTSAELASGLIEALGQSKAKTLGATLIEKLPKLPAVARPTALRLVLGRPESAKAFLDAVEKGSVRFDLLQLDQKQALAAHPDKALAERAKKLLAAGGGLPNPDRQKVIDELKPILAKTGDVPNGKKMFTTHCAKCHKHGAEGLQIGPDLTGFAVHPKEEILIHVLDPSRSVEGNYKAYTAKHLDGRVVTGVMSAQTKTTVELRDAENKLWNFQLADLDALVESKLSLMPEGFEKQMKPEELTDLLEFLTQKGKYVPIPLDKYATSISTKGMFFEDDGPAERLVFKDWTPKTFEGVPFVLTDPNGDKTKNAILLYGPNGKKAPLMPKSISMPCNTAAKAIHVLGGIGGWNFPASPKGTVSLIVRLHYADGKTEDHELKNGVQIADYIRKVDVPESKFAFAMEGGQQVRYLAVNPKRTDAVIKAIELVKGPDSSAPVVMAVTIETP